jgi:hypothetical protein
MYWVCSHPVSKKFYCINPLCTIPHECTLVVKIQTPASKYGHVYDMLDIISLTKYCTMLQARELCKHKTKLCCRCACHKGICRSGCRQEVSFTTQFNSIHFVLGRSKEGCNPQDIEHVTYISSQRWLNPVSIEELTGWASDAVWTLRDVKNLLPMPEIRP